MTFGVVIKRTRIRVDHDLMGWHPTFAINSERPAWVQALRGVAYFVVGSVVVVGLLAGGGFAKSRWDRYQEERADRARYAALGLRSVCTGAVEAKCVERAASLAHVAVASTPAAYGDLLVAVGPPKAAAVAELTASPTRRMIGHFKAVEYVLFSFDVYTAPTSRPDYPYRSRGAVVVDGVRVEVRSAPALVCSSLTEQRAKQMGCAEDVWAEWRHDGQLYAANFWSPSRSRAEKLKSVFREISYAEG